MSQKDEQKNIPKCAMCNEPRSTKYRPFCSKRCADIDLNRWLTGQYAIPVEEDEPDDHLGELSQSDDEKLN
ncbi:MAG: hypothetical protein DHS20C08_21220 [Rhodomicrobium sp.]|nr:MAG: hypothetical protein DHS20C08_21220 [Rhodomicrobium sp.]